jgi:hypothetical protein
LIILPALGVFGHFEILAAAQTNFTQQNALPPGHPAISTSPAAASDVVEPPKLRFQVPPGWEEAPLGELRVASFRVVGKGGKLAEVGVIRMPGLMGSDLISLNRWRGQVGLPAVTEEELPKLANPVEIGGKPARLFEQAGENPGSGEKSRILVAIQKRDGIAWFFKIVGDDKLVAQQKPAFLEFLKSVRLPEPMAQPALPPSHVPIGKGTPGQAPAADSPRK